MAEILQPIISSLTGTGEGRSVVLRALEGPFPREHTAEINVWIVEESDLRFVDFLAAGDGGLGATEVDSTFDLEEIVARLRAAVAQLTIGFHQG